MRSGGDVVLLNSTTFRNSVLPFFTSCGLHAADVLHAGGLIKAPSTTSVGMALWPQLEAHALGSAGADSNADGIEVSPMPKEACAEVVAEEKDSMRQIFESASEFQVQRLDPVQTPDGVVRYECWSFRTEVEGSSHRLKLDCWICTEHPDHTQLYPNATPCCWLTEGLDTSSHRFQGSVACAKLGAMLRGGCMAYSLLEEAKSAMSLPFQVAPRLFGGRSAMDDDAGDVDGDAAAGSETPSTPAAPEAATPGTLALADRSQQHKYRPKGRAPPVIHR